MPVNFISQKNYIIPGVLGVIIGVLLTISLASNLITTAIMVSGLVLTLVLIYLFVFHYTSFQTFFIFLIPLSVPISASGNVMTLPSELIVFVLGTIMVLRSLLYQLPPYAVFKHPISISLLSVIIWGIFTAATSTLPEVSFKRVLMTFFFIAVFYFAYQEYFSDLRRIRAFFYAYAIGLIIPILWSLIEHARRDFSMVSAFNVNKPFYPEHTIYAACISFALMVLVFMKRNIYQRVFSLPLIIWLVIGVFFSFSRAAWISIGLSMLVFFNYRYKPPNWLKIGLFVAILAIAYANLNRIIDEFEYNREVGYKGDLTEHVRSLTNISNDASNAERINRWISALDMFKEKPFLGFGPGTYQFKYGNYQRQEWMTRISTFQGDGGNAHSEYLNVLSEQGVIGLILFIVLILTGFFTAQKLLFNLPAGRERNLVLCILVGGITYFAHGAVNSFIDVDKAAVLVYGSFAALTALDLKNREKSSVVNH